MDFIWLLFAHYIGDIALQNSWQAENKGRYWYVMLSHCMIYGASICVALQFLGIYTFWKAVFLIGGHWASDYLKTKVPSTPANWKWIYPDQGWHIIQLAIVFLSRPGA
jgi:hypothetical protein